MQFIRQQWLDLAARRRFIMLVSGISIVLAFLSSWGFGNTVGRDASMVLAAIVAGTDIAVRAVRALLNRQVTIELLVTLAAGGALIIGECWESAAVTVLFVLGAWLEARTLGRRRAARGQRRVRALHVRVS